jgi:hypothetical protein
LGWSTPAARGEGDGDGFMAPPAGCRRYFIGCLYRSGERKGGEQSSVLEQALAWGAGRCAIMLLVVVAWPMARMKSNVVTERDATERECALSWSLTPNFHARQIASI